MKIAKLSEHIRNIQRTTEYSLSVENSKGEEREILVEKWVRDDDYETDNGMNFSDEFGKEITEDEIREFLGEDKDDYSDDYDTLMDYIWDGCPDPVNEAEELELSYQELFNGIIKLWKDGDPEPLDGDQVDKLCEFIKKEINKIEANN